MKIMVFLLPFLFFGCAKQHTVLKAGPEVEIQMHDEADRLRTILDRHLKTKESTSEDGLYQKALEHENI